MLRRKNGISIYYEIEGILTEPVETIVLIGGLTRDHTIWRKVVPLLKEKYRIILPDNRDSGRSSSPDANYDIVDLADDVADMLTCINMGPAHVIGHSMGGFMGFYIAAKYPELVKTLTLCSTAERQTDIGIAYLNARIQSIMNYPSDQQITIDRASVSSVMDKIYAPVTLENKAFVEEIIDFEVSNPCSQSRDAFVRQANACIRHNAEELLKDIRCPTLVVTGEYDKVYPAELAFMSAKKLYNASTVIIPNAAHMLQLEQPKLLAEALQTFIDANQG
jgi:pimeloyl-ACP methyl ester carboxylesterase